MYDIGKITYALYITNVIIIIIIKEKREEKKEEKKRGQKIFLGVLEL